MRSNPDDRKDNVDRIQENIDNTIQNIHQANEMIKNEDNEKTKRDLKAKNCRREESLNELRSEIKDEAAYKKRGYE